jgi:protein gp37
MVSGRRPAFAGWVGAAHQDWWFDAAGAQEDFHRFDPDDQLWSIGKKAAGRLLDGWTHDAMPAIAARPVAPA